MRVQCVVYCPGMPNCAAVQYARHGSACGSQDTLQCKRRTDVAADHAMLWALLRNMLMKRGHQPYSPYRVQQRRNAGHCGRMLQLVDHSCHLHVGWLLFSTLM